jgi:hypothetical protein
MENFLKASEAALSDSQQDVSSFQVVVAPKGASKTTCAAALVHAIIASGSESSVVVALPEIKLVEEFRLELLKHGLVSEKDLGVWTTAHAMEKSHADIIAQCGWIAPVRYLKDDLNSRRVILLTHKTYMEQLSYRLYRGQRRTLSIIDEKPDEAGIFSARPSTIDSLKEKALEANLESLGPPLDLIHDHMRALSNAANDGDMHQEIPVSIGLHLALSIVTGCSYTEKDAISKLYDDPTDFLNTFGFLNALLEGSAFLSRNSGDHFVGYRMAFQRDPGTIVLDGTSDIDGLTPISHWVKLHIGPKADYRHLTGIHVQIPHRFGSKRGMDRIQTDGDFHDEFMSYLRGQIVEHAMEGEEVLVFLKKKIATMNKPNLITNHNDFSQPMTIEGRKVAFANFGSGIGQNRWRSATTVILIDHMRLPRRMYVGKALAHKGQPATNNNLHDAKEVRGLKGDFKSVQDGQRLRWDLQSALRGAAREVEDTTGIAKPMKLVLVGDLAVWAAEFGRCFNNAPPLACSGSEQTSSKKLELVRLLMTFEAERLTLGEAVRLTGMNDLTKNVGKHIKDRDVAAVMQSHGWRYVRSKPSAFIKVTGNQ